MSFPQTNFKPPFNITRASHLVFTAQDLAASKAFYTEVVGLARTRGRQYALAARGRGARPPQPHTEEDHRRAICEAVGMHVFDEEDLDKAKSYFDQVGSRRSSLRRRSRGARCASGTTWARRSI